jgi:uncharacterized LabA/DUF88 family protein
MIQLVPPKPFQPQKSQSDTASGAASGVVVPAAQVSSAQPDIERTDRGRVILFIDGASLFYAAMQMEIEVDYAHLLSRLSKGGRLIHSHFYTSVDPHNEKQKGFLYWMQCNGYRVITKDLVSSAAGTRKVNLNVEITVDMLRLAPYCDTMILVSGDGDLACALDFITYQGVQTEVVGLRSMMSESLINVADYYTDLATIRRTIQKRAA